MKTKLNELEDQINEALLLEIQGCGNDPVDLFKALERYKLFNEGTKLRAESDYHKWLPSCRGDSR